MPTYEYRCRTCDVRFEVRQSFAEDSLTSCPAAGSEQSPAACVAPGEGVVRKVFSAPSIAFKGDGFYKTDSRSSSVGAGNGAKDGKPAEHAKKSAEVAGSASGGESGESSGTAGGESKGEPTGKSGGSAKSGESKGGSKGDRATAGAGSS